MMNPVLDVLHFWYSWDIQVEKLKRQIYVSGNQKRCNAHGKYFTVLDHPLILRSKLKTNCGILDSKVTTTNYHKLGGLVHIYSITIWKLEIQSEGVSRD